MITTPRPPDPSLPLWGAQTAEAVATFDVHGVRLSSVPLLVVALAAVKDASVRASRRLGRLPQATAAAIGDACREIGDGHWHDQFVVDVRNGGSARQLQANADEVLARRAHEIRQAADGGSVELADLSAGIDLHPLSLRLAAILAAHDLLEDLHRLRRELRLRATALGDARTTDDAVLLSLRGRLVGYARDVDLQELRLQETLVALHEVPVLAGDVDRRDFIAVLTEELSTGVGLQFVPVEAAEVSAPAGSLLTLSRVLKPLAVRLAQWWSGLSTLAEAGGMPAPDGQRRRSELVNRTALDVIGAILQDEVRLADGPYPQAEPALTVSVLASMAKLGEATCAVAEWCREDVGATSQSTLAA